MSQLDQATWNQLTIVLIEFSNKWHLEASEYVRKNSERVLTIANRANIIVRIFSDTRAERVPIRIEREVLVSVYPSITDSHLQHILGLKQSTSKLFVHFSELDRFISKMDILLDLDRRTQRGRYKPVGRLPKAHLMRRAIGEYYDGTNDARLRRQCIAFYGAKCVICGFDYEAIYGERGKGRIHVHHKDLKRDRQGKLLYAGRDLVPVCGNCHHMLHTTRPPISVEELREIIEKSSKQAPMSK